MNSEDGQVFSVCIMLFSCLTKYNRIQSKHKQTNYKHSRRNLNPIKAGGSESMYSLGGGHPTPPPLEKGLRE